MKRMILLAAVLGLFLSGVAPARAGVIVNFDGVDASGGPVTGAAVDSYLATYGITLSNVTPGTSVRIETVSYLVPPSPPNILWQGGPPHAESFNVNFAALQSSFGFTRVEFLSPTSSGTITPAWTASAFDSMGHLLDQVGEPIISSFSGIPSHSFVLNGPGIAWVTFASDAHGFAGTAGVALDDFVLSNAAVPEPASLTLLGIAIAGMAGYGWRRRRQS
jgi:hypothetical protein